MGYLDLLNIKYKNPLKIILLVFLVVIIAFIFLNKPICEVYNTFGYVDEDRIIVNIPLNNIEVINKIEYLKINSKKCSKEVLNISDVLLDQNSFVNYQEVSFGLDEDYLKNQILNVTIYYKKEKVLTKLKKLL